MSNKLLKQFVQLLMLSEAVGDDPQKQTQLGDSLDSAIDKFLMNAEKKEIAAVEEADEPEEPTEDATGGKLDAEHYAKTVARLMKHYNNLLDIPNTIMRRALNYVTTNYDQMQSQAVKEILTKEFQVGPDVPDLEYDVTAPGADRAGPTPGGGAPGG